MRVAIRSRLEQFKRYKTKAEELDFRTKITVFKILQMHLKSYKKYTFEIFVIFVSSILWGWIDR